MKNRTAFALLIAAWLTTMTVLVVGLTLTPCECETSTRDMTPAQTKAVAEARVHVEHGADEAEVIGLLMADGWDFGNASFAVDYLDPAVTCR